MPDHRVITTFTLVKFLLSFAAFTEVLVSVYTRKMFTWVSKLSYLSKPFKSKHGISDTRFTDPPPDRNITIRKPWRRKQKHVSYTQYQ